ncbi:hypothetical protein ACOTEA_03505, partial [Achromobacter xylosoxidans]
RLAWRPITGLCEAPFSVNRPWFTPQGGLIVALVHAESLADPPISVISVLTEITEIPTVAA